MCVGDRCSCLSLTELRDAFSQERVRLGLGTLLRFSRSGVQESISSISMAGDQAGSGHLKEEHSGTSRRGTFAQ